MSGPSMGTDSDPSRVVVETNINNLQVKIKYFFHIL